MPGRGAYGLSLADLKVEVQGSASTSARDRETAESFSFAFLDSRQLKKLSALLVQGECLSDLETWLEDYGRRNQLGWYSGIALEDRQGRLRGLLRYALETGTGCGRSFEVEQLLLVEPDDRPARAALLDAAEIVAKRLGCVCMHLTVPDGDPGSIRREILPFLEAGYRRSVVRLCKSLFPSE